MLSFITEGRGRPGEEPWATNSRDAFHESQVGYAANERRIVNMPHQEMQDTDGRALLVVCKRIIDGPRQTGGGERVLDWMPRWRSERISCMRFALPRLVLLREADRLCWNVA